jgi:hypothetical protein
MSLPPVLRSWKVKAVAQKTISALPGSDRLNYLLQCHLTGTAAGTEDWYWFNMVQAARHLANWREATGAQKPPTTALELGTGWHLTVPLCLALSGVETVTTVDRRSLLRPKRLAEGLRLLLRLLDAGPPDGFPPVDEERRAILKDLASRPAISAPELVPLGVQVRVGDVGDLGSEVSPVELFHSNNVLEHIAPSDLPNILATYRILAADGAVMSHFIDLADHFSAFDPSISSRNFLRYTSRQWRLWDNELVPQNRLQISDYRKAHADAGFIVCSEEVERAPATDLNRFELAPEFSRYPPDELLVQTAWMVSRAA